MKIFNPESEQLHFAKKELIGLFGLFIILWSFLFFKAAYMGLFHDELMTFFYYIHSGVIYPPEAHLDANNHFLNSQLSRWSYLLFGNSPLAVRLPNVLAYPIFFFAIASIAARFKDILVRWSFMLSLVMCGFIFEYFAMTRGYGLSIMFLSLAIWGTIRMMETNKIKFLLFVCICLWFSVAANMTMLIYSVLLLSFVFLQSVYVDFRAKKQLLFLKFLILAITAFTFVGFVSWSFEMKESGLLIHGSLEGLYVTTVRTLSNHAIGVFHMSIGIFVYLIFWSSILLLLSKVFRSRSFQFIFSFNGFFIYMLGFSVLSLVLMAKLLEINYPEDRTAMFLLVFLFASFCVLVSNLKERYEWTRYAILILLFLPLKFLIQFHPADSQNFDAGRHSDRIFEMVEEMETPSKFPLSVSVRGFQQLTWYYSNLRHGGKLGAACHTYFPQLSADIILKEPIDVVPENEQLYQLYDSLYTDPFTGITLFKRKEFLRRELIEEIPISSVEKAPHEYFNFLKLDADSLHGETIYLGVELTLEAEHNPFRSRLVAAVDRTEEPQNIFYDYVQLDWIKSSYRGEQNNVVLGALIPEISDEAEIIAFYLWNPDLIPFSIRDGKCYLYRLERDF